MTLTGMLGRMGILHGDDDTLGEEVLVDGDQVLLRHQHDGRSDERIEILDLNITLIDTVRLKKETLQLESKQKRDEIVHHNHGPADLDTKISS